MTEFEKVYRAYFQDVYLFARRLSGDDSVAEEVTSEAFLKAMASLESFRGECSVRVWLCQIAKNCYFSYLKKQRRILPLETIDTVTLEDAGQLEEQLSDKLSSMEAHKLLHDLPEPYREVFSLRVFGELGFRQIGTLFGKTENWACVTYHRARKKLREALEGKNNGI